jgi:hypothetical protein
MYCVIVLSLPVNDGIVFPNSGCLLRSPRYLVTTDDSHLIRSSTWNSVFLPGLFNDVFYIEIDKT